MSENETPQGRELGDEEFAALEAQLLETVKLFHQSVHELTRSLAADHPDIAGALEASADSVLRNAELAASIQDGEDAGGSA